MKIREGWRFNVFENHFLPKLCEMEVTLIDTRDRENCVVVHQLTEKIQPLKCTNSDSGGYVNCHLKYNKTIF